ERIQQANHSSDVESQIKVQIFDYETQNSHELINHYKHHISHGIHIGFFAIVGIISRKDESFKVTSNLYNKPREIKKIFYDKNMLQLIGTSITQLMYEDFSFTVTVPIIYKNQKQFFSTSNLPDNFRPKDKDSYYLTLNLYRSYGKERNKVSFFFYSTLLESLNFPKAFHAFHLGQVISFKRTVARNDKVFHQFNFIRT
ncbi:hypothetical protein M153_2660003, partial [Pseudoloma neurophilia]